MNLFKMAWEYMLKNEHNFGWYEDKCENIFEELIFVFLICCIGFGAAVVVVVSFITVPVWIAPYLIYKGLKRRNKHEQE